MESLVHAHEAKKGPSINGIIKATEKWILRELQYQISSQTIQQLLSHFTQNHKASFMVWLEDSLMIIKVRSMYFLRIINVFIKFYQSIEYNLRYFSPEQKQPANTAALKSQVCDDNWLKNKWAKVRAELKHPLQEGEGRSTGEILSGEKESKTRELVGG